MSKDEPTNLFECPSDEIGAYLDAELSPERELALESHFAECDLCRTELNSQKLFLLALNLSLETGNSVEIPKNFAKTIAAKAESRVVGLRSRSERIVAFAISVLLLFLAAAAFGGGNGNFFSPALGIVDRAASVVDVFLHLSYSVVFGAVSLIKNAVFGIANQTPPMVLIGFVFAIFISVAVFVRFVRPDRHVG